jgi:CelD/BcsL family acetyltransferase involved in cellulose biosynthesis
MTAALDAVWALERWRAVLGRIDDPHPFATPEWQRAWWEHFGAGELDVVELGEVGVAALQRQGDEVRFLGSRDVTDYPGPAIIPGAEREAATRLLAHLRPGDRLEVDNAQPAFAAALEAAADGRDVSRVPGEAVAILTLPATWDEYAGSLRRHTRHEIERKRRRARGARVRAGDLDTLFAFMRAAPGEKGRFLTPRIEAFLREATAGARIDELVLDGRPLAVTLGFQGPRTYYLYNMGYDPAAAHLSPGIVLLAALIERAIEERVARFDFMRGLEHYKLQLGAVPSSLIALRLAPRAAGRFAR